MIHVSITDDHELFRSGIAMLLGKCEDMTIVSQSASAEELLAALEHTPVDVALIDITMREMSGLDALDIIRKKHPETRCIVLTMHNEAQYVLKAIRSGAHGYLLKDCDEDELRTAVRTVYKGKKHFNSDISQLMVKGMTEENDLQQLSKRETEVLRLVAQGKTTKEIANELFVSTRTIETHRSNILRKLDVQNTAELITKANQLNLL